MSNLAEMMEGRGGGWLNTLLAREGSRAGYVSLIILNRPSETQNGFADRTDAESENQFTMHIRH